MNYFEMGKSVRGNSTYAKPKIVMISTETEPANVARAMSAGEDEFPKKPLAPHMLMDTLPLVGAN